MTQEQIKSAIVTINDGLLNAFDKRDALQVLLSIAEDRLKYGMGLSEEKIIQIMEDTQNQLMDKRRPYFEEYAQAIFTKQMEG